MSDSDWNPRQAWYRLRLEAEAIQNYPLSFSLYLGHTHRDPLLEGALPALLYIKAVALLDASIEEFFKRQGYLDALKESRDLYKKIEFLKSHRLVDNPDALHEIRQMRNNLAHGTEHPMSWEGLRTALYTIEAELIALDLARATGSLEAFAERSALTLSDEPGVKMEREFAFGVKENGDVALEVAWQQKILDE